MQKAVRPISPMERTATQCPDAGAVPFRIGFAMDRLRRSPGSPRGATPLPEWDLMGVVRGPREADPRIQSELWVAWARGPDGERVEGRGESPEQAWTT